MHAIAGPCLTITMISLCASGIQRCSPFDLLTTTLIARHELHRVGTSGLAASSPFHLISKTSLASNLWRIELTEPGCKV
jgi:hypothetical protein